MLLDEISKRIHMTIGTVFFIGYFPKMPGTIASLVAALVWYLVPYYRYYNPIESTVHVDSFFIVLLLISLLFIAGVASSKELEALYGKDSPKIVIDEVVGYFIAILFLPKTTMVVFYAFILFRLFDIFKPFGIKKLEKIPNGFGVMLDDVAAGILANLVIQLIRIIRPEFLYLI